jgi:diguanylate cyclase (GGDEF)-like protein/PAS domain S-box-containing protein
MDKAQCTILVVDHRPKNLTLLSQILTDSGYQVQVADDAEWAIEYARKATPDLILLDISRPAPDSYEICQRLKRGRGTRKIPIIFIGTKDGSADKVKAFRAGCVDYIQRPFEPEEVRAHVETHLTILRLRHQLQEVNQQKSTQLEELTRSQDLLRERERKLQAFVNAIPSLSFVFDEEGRYLEIMAHDFSLLSDHIERLKGRLISEVLPADGAHSMMNAIRRTIETGKTQVIEYKVPILSGDERWFEGRFALMEKGRRGHSKVVLIATEITDRVNLYQEVNRLAMQDPLTGCYNRRHFLALANQEIQRALRYHRPLSLLMLDIDHFKRFNDRYGHLVGDQILCAMVNLCQNSLRSVDILGRYGGDEFLILMPETAVEGTVPAAQRLRKAVEDMVMTIPEGKFSITVCVGVASLEVNRKPAETLDELVKRADQGLYAAKSAGRNCVRSG